MQFVATLLVFLLIAKDVMFAPAPDLLRAVSQGLCLAAAVVTLPSLMSADLLRRYWPVLGYLAAIFISALTAQLPGFVLLQALSMASVILFSIAYFEDRRRLGQSPLTGICQAIVIAYAIPCVLGLLILRYPELSYNRLGDDSVDVDIRFHGVFSMSGWTAAAGGILAGVAATTVRRRWLRWACVAIGLVTVVLAQSRSFWAGVLVATVVVGWRYGPRALGFEGRVFPIALAATAVAIVTVIAAGAAPVWLQDFARLDTVQNLTGRASLWSRAFGAIADAGALGQGFTLGGLSLVKDSMSDTGLQMLLENPRAISKTTLHNGYLQSWFDVGAIGFSFYALAIAASIRRLWLADSARCYPTALFLLVMLTVANAGESAIYTAANFHSACFWIFASFALGLQRSSGVDVLVKPQERRSRFPNLLGTS